MSTTQNYVLSKQKTNTNPTMGLAEFMKYLAGDIPKLAAAFFLIIFNSAAGIVTPYLIALATDNFIVNKNLDGLWQIVLALGSLYLVTVVCGYAQTRIMGTVSQNTLFRLRTALFAKIQQLPIAFFNQNKAGDLISRVNNDADKLNQLLSETLVRFASNVFVVIGIAVFICFLNLQMALLTLVGAGILAVITNFSSPFIRSTNKQALEATGSLSSEIQESLNNFKVIVAFNRRDFFQQRFEEANTANFNKTIRSEIANGIFKPLYDLAGYATQIAILAYGLYQIQQGNLSVGLLIGFLGYSQKFYEPLRMLGSLWGNLQSSLAAWTRLKEVLDLESNLVVIQKN